MCGIAGKVGEFDPYQIQGLIYANRARGIGGFGAAWPKKNKWAFAKRGKDYADVLGDVQFSDILSQNCLLAHTRAPSGGLGHGSRQIDANSHPFVVNDTLMAHNGRFRNDNILSKRYVDEYKWDVDSDALCAVIDAIGMEKAFSEFTGSAGIWLANRNDPRYFWLWCWDQDLAIWEGNNGGFVFSSELRHLNQWGFTNANGRVGELDRDAGFLFKVDSSTGEFDFKSVKGYEPPKIVPKSTYSYFKTGDHVYKYKDPDIRNIEDRIYGTVMAIAPHRKELYVHIHYSTEGNEWWDEKDVFKVATKPAISSGKSDKEETGVVVVGKEFHTFTLKNILAGSAVQACPFCGSLSKPKDTCPCCAEFQELNLEAIQWLACCETCNFIGDYQLVPSDVGECCPVCNQTLSAYYVHSDEDRLLIMRSFAAFYSRQTGGSWSAEELEAWAKLDKVDQEAYQKQRLIVTEDSDQWESYDG